MCRVGAEGDVSLRTDYPGHLVESIRDDLSHLIMGRHSDHDDQVDRARHRIHLADAAERGDLLRDFGNTGYLSFHENDRSDHGGILSLELPAPSLMPAPLARIAP